MKFAIVDNVKSEPKKGLSGVCPFCKKPVIAKCGQKKIHHWSHKGKLECDVWWENETEWHRNWKSHFPIDLQEVIHVDELTGERHIADVKTEQNWVIEFQHSHLKPKEFESRNKFYKKLVWVVDGKRLKRTEEEIISAVNSGVQYGFVRKISPQNCSQLRDWSSEHPVCFDFGKEELIVLLPKCYDGILYVFSFSRSEFIEIFLKEGTDKAINFKNILVNFSKMLLLHHILIQQQKSQQVANDQQMQQIRNAYRARYGTRRRIRL